MARVSLPSPMSLANLFLVLATLALVRGCGRLQDVGQSPLQAPGTCLPGAENLSPASLRQTDVGPVLVFLSSILFVLPQY